MTEARIAQLAEAKKKQAIVLDHSQANERKLGTVGAVARDRSGNLAAATSTGGLVNQQWGRVGDSAIIGAGVFADNASCAVSCTGIGEHLLRTSLAKTAALFVEYRGVRADEAAHAAIRYLVDKVHGLGGLIIVDRDGTCARAIRHRACSPQRPRTASYAYRRRNRQHMLIAVSSGRLAHTATIDARERAAVDLRISGHQRTGPAVPIISRRMILSGAKPPASRRSWKSVRENLSPIFAR